MKWIVGAGVLAIAGIALAQRRPPPVLHEYVEPPPPSSGRAGRIVDPTAAPAAASSEPGADDPIDPGQNPPAIRQADKLIPEPLKSTARRGDEPVLSPDVAPDRETTVPPDRDTDADSTLEYSEPFNPSVLPFKRMTALDGVARDYSLQVHDRKLRPLAVGGEPDADRDLFYASVLVQLEGNRDVPIPSVAPDMRILSYEVAPITELTFSRDGADNYFVRPTDPTVAGQFRLVFLADAPVTYFAPEVPDGLTIADIAAAGMAPAPMPPSVRTVARRVHERVGVSASQPLDVALDKLIAWFRAFEAGASPPSTGDIYWDLTMSQTGVCRHRAFAFAVTANALGIPTRYVTNEAHAFVEVWVPRAGWLRVDLGGAAQTLDVSNTEDKAMYRPRGEDPFPKPPEYSENHTMIRGRFPGLRDDQVRDAQTPYDPAAPPDDARSTAPVTPRASGLPAIERGPGLDGRARTTLAIDAVAPSAFRGERVTVSGKARAGAGAGDGLPVQIYLAPRGERDRARLVGETIAAADGTFLLTVELPIDLEVGSHEVYAHTAGDAKRTPALSD
jgi:hypothetical protein